MFSEERENLNDYRLLIKWFGASLGKNIVGLDGGVGHSLAGSRRFAEIAHFRQDHRDLWSQTNMERPAGQSSRRETTSTLPTVTNVISAAFLKEP